MADSSTDATPSTISPSPGMSSPAETETRSSDAQLGAGNLLDSAVRCVALRHGFRSGPAQRFCLGLAAALGHGFGEVGKQNGEPEPQRDLQVKAECLVRMENQKDRRDDAADFDDEHDGIAHHVARVEFEQRTPHSAADEFQIPNRFVMACHIP